MKLKTLLIVFLISFNTYADIHILISKNPSSELGTLIPNTQDTFDFDKTFSTLLEAQDYIITLNNGSTTINDNVTIYVREGVYDHQYLTWEITSPLYTIKITNYNNEKVVFDGSNVNSNGKLPAQFIRLKEKYERTNLWVEGLIIQNYQNGIALGRTELIECKYFKGIQNSHNTIKNNVFRSIGTRRDTSMQDVAGYSALGLSNSTNNIIDSNVFYQIENKENDSIAIHAMYIVNYSNNNTIKNNYIALCDKSPIKIRNACNNNIFDRNYIEQSGNHGRDEDTGFFEAWYCDSTNDDSIFYIPNCNECNEGRKEEPSLNNLLTNNTCTFPYPTSTIPISLYISKTEQDEFIIDNNFVIGEHPECEQIGSATSGDINGDGLDETFLAFNYNNFTKLVRSRPETPHYLSKVLYVSKFWHIGALEMNDFNNDGAPELITAFNALTSNQDNTQIYKGDGVNAVSNFGRLYRHDWWTTTSITSGDYDNDGSIEIFTAFNAPDTTGNDNTQIFKGTGTGTTPLGNLGKVYNHPWWLTKSMVSGDFDGDGSDEVYIAYNAPDTTGNDNTQIFKGTGTGTTPLGNLGQKFNHPWWYTGAMTTGDFNGNGSDEIVIAYNGPDNSRDDTTVIYRGNGENAISNYGQLYNDYGWRTGMLISGEFGPSNGDELMTTLISNTRSQSYLSTGTGAITNLGQFHRTDEIIPCVQNLLLKNSSTPNEQKHLEDNKIFIHPNPTNRFSGFTISGLSDNSQIKIYSNTGRLIKSYVNQRNISTQNLASGLYIIKIINSTKTVVRKMIIK